VELPELRELRAVTGPDGLAMSRKVRGIICVHGRGGRGHGAGVHKGCSFAEGSTA
jgi:hypothetical protein